MAKNVKDLMSKKDDSKNAGLASTGLLKQLLTKGMSGGKVKAVKLKIKMK